MCCAILIKLLLDTWIRAGAATAFSAALLVLSRAAGSGDVAARVRAYDLLLNLSVHAELLNGMDAGDAVGPPEPHKSPADADADADPADGRADSHASSGNVTDAQDAAELHQWLYDLLLRLLENTLKASEPSNIHGPSEATALAGEKGSALSNPGHISKCSARWLTKPTRSGRLLLLVCCISTLTRAYSWTRQHAAWLCRWWLNSCDALCAAPGV